MYHIEFLPTVNDSSCCSTSLSAFGGVSVLDFGHSIDKKCVEVSRSFSQLHFSDTIPCGTSFPTLICHLCIFFGEVSLKVFGSLF